MRVFNLREQDLDKVEELGNLVHGANYQPTEFYENILKKSAVDGINSSFVAYDTLTDDLIGFRVTYAPCNWDIDHWCTPDVWDVPPEKVCYFKSNTVHPDFQRRGLGSLMLSLAIDASKLQGAEAGLAHIWMGSPGNSAYKYFCKAGAEVIRVYEDRWRSDFKDFGFVCATDGTDCHCSGSEMLLRFEKGEEDV